MMKKFFNFVLVLVLFLSGCATGKDHEPTATSINVTDTPMVNPTTLPTDMPIATNTNLPVETVVSNTVVAPTTPVVFPVGPGGVDVIPHQIVRTNDDYLYIFSSAQGSRSLRMYRTLRPGFPESAADFAPMVEFVESNEIISVDALYDGESTIHVIINTLHGEVKDYPFDTATNTYKSAVILATDSGVIDSGLYIGTSGITGMVDMNGTIHIAYWTNKNHIVYRAYSYNATANLLTPAGDAFQVDGNGDANHPVLAVSPADNSVTVAWISQSDTPALIRARTRANNGTWGDIEIASTFQFPAGVSVWTSTENGLNIDQGPSLIIDAAGIKYMVYIESFNAAIGDYGRVHYVTNNGSGWVDKALNFLSHDPAISLNTSGEIYVIGHGHHRDPVADEPCYSMDTMCFVKMDMDGTWGIPTTIIEHTDQGSFDSSPSVKWSAVGFNRPEIVEFVFFMTPYESPTLYYGRLP